MTKDEENNGGQIYKSFKQAGIHTIRGYTGAK